LASGVVVAGDGDVEVEVGLFELDGEEGDRLVERVVRAEEGRDVARCRDVGDGGGEFGRVSLFVVDGRGGLVVVASVDVAAAGSRRGETTFARNLTRGTGRDTEPDGVGGFAGSLDDDVVALANGEFEEVGLIRLERDEVLSDDGHLVTIERDEKDTFGARVDQTEEMFLAGLEFEG